MKRLESHGEMVEAIDGDAWRYTGLLRENRESLEVEAANEEYLEYGDPSHPPKSASCGFFHVFS